MAHKKELKKNNTINPVYLAYIDESGNTGLDLENKEQPIFALGALLVPASDWLSIESELDMFVAQFFSEIPEDQNEIHTHKLVNGSKPFRDFGQKYCLDFQEKWMQVAQKYKLQFFSGGFRKKAFKESIHKNYSSALQLNPHEIAFPLLSNRVNQFLRNQASNPLGILISDEHKELSLDLETTLKLLKKESSELKHDRIIEKCFFIDSSKSLLLQLCDMCVYYARKKLENEYGFPVREHHKKGIQLLNPLLSPDNSSDVEMFNWLDLQIKKRPGI